MYILNVHQRNVSQPIEEIAALIDTLSSREDLVWPKEKWPAMRLDNGLKVGSKGGHGPIRYIVSEHLDGKATRFKFTRPKGFNGSHGFELYALAENKTLVKHIIQMNVTGSGLISWTLAIRWLHDALVEDAFDKIENRFSNSKKEQKYSLWVQFLRQVFKHRFFLQKG